MNPIEAFETLDLRVGRIVRAEPNERARKPAYKLWIDFGPLGEKHLERAAQGALPGRGAGGPTRRGGGEPGARATSRGSPRRYWCWVCRTTGEVVLLAAERDVPLGGRVY